LFKDAVLGWNRIGYLRIAPRDAVIYDFNDETKEGTGGASLPTGTTML
jgi:hypothetical protein